jgi:hypothetical protein
VVYDAVEDRGIVLEDWVVAAAGLEVIDGNEEVAEDDGNTVGNEPPAELEGTIDRNKEVAKDDGNNEPPAELEEALEEYEEDEPAVGVYCCAVCAEEVGFPEALVGVAILGHNVKTP